MAQADSQVLDATMDGPLPRVDIGAPERARALLDAPGVIAVEVPRPRLEGAPYLDFVKALAQRPFKVDFNADEPHKVFAMLADQLLGGGYEAARAAMAHDVDELFAFARGIGGGGQVIATVRNYFAPGDLVWHVDHSYQSGALRILWPMGRPGGMRVTPVSNIDEDLHSAFMSREYPLLFNLDRRVADTPGATLETLWAHRPRQIETMIAGRFPFVRDEAKVIAVPPGSASVHWLETPSHKGTYHRSSWENRHQPGLQFVLTVGDL